MNEMLVEPVLPTYARTLSRLLTSMAVVYERIIITVEMMAKRHSDMSPPLGLDGALLFDKSPVLLGLPDEGESS